MNTIPHPTGNRLATRLSAYIRLYGFGLFRAFTRRKCLVRDPAFCSYPIACLSFGASDVWQPSISCDELICGASLTKRLYLCPFHPPGGAGSLHKSNVSGRLSDVARLHLPQRRAFVDQEATSLDTGLLANCLVRWCREPDFFPFCVTHSFPETALP
jgi:hypothetical protein